MRSLILAVLLVAAVPAFGQAVSPEEAAKRLAERQKARDAARSRPVTITQGELDDLRAELVRLRAEVAQLKGSVSLGNGAAVERVNGIAIGITRDQLFDFLHRHPNEYEITRDTISTPRVTARTMTTTSQNQSQTSGVQNGQQSTGQTTGANQGTTQEKMVEEGEKTETIGLNRKAYQSVAVGEHKEYNGVTESTVTDTKKAWVKVETITVKIVEGKVASVERR